MIQRREFLKAASMTVVGSVLPAQASSLSETDTAQKERAATLTPNILIIIADGYRAGLTKRSGYPLDVSPALDAMAERGVAFDTAYATCPVCVPSRTTMLTGRWPEAHHVRMNLQAQVQSAIHEAYFEKDIYDVAKEKGYVTGLIGKNHTYLQSSKLDFWREYSHTGGWKSADSPHNIAEYDSWLKGLGYNVSLQPTPFPLETQLPYRIVSDAITFMDEYRSKPFALQLSIPEPHDPEQLPSPYWDMFPPDQVPARCAGPEALSRLGYKAQWLYGLEQDGFPASEKSWRRYKSNYLGMLRLINDQLTRLTDFMRSKDLLRNTLIVFVADHGDYLMDYGLARKGVGLPESLIRIPMVWSGWEVKHTNTPMSAFVSMADVMPTLCEAIGSEIPNGVQGRSLLPLLQGQSYPHEEFRSIYAGVGLGGLYYEGADNVHYNIAEHSVKDAAGNVIPGVTMFDELNMVTQSGSMKMVRMGDWKLLYDMMGYGQLYHLASDPCELNNLFGDASAQKEQAQLMEELLMWVIRSQDSLPTGPQTRQYQTKWPRKHNWYAPYRHGSAPEAFIP